MKRSMRDIKGFTLLEVLLSLAIFLLLAGGIFAAVSVSTRVSTDLTVARLDGERLDAMQGFLRRMFSNVPGTARFELRVRQHERGESGVELLVGGAPEFTCFSQALPSGGVAISAQPDARGAYRFSLANYDDTASEVERDRQLRQADWIGMLPDVKAVRWRFASNEGRGWRETWKPGDGRPGLAELEITLSSGDKALWQFFIPAVMPGNANGGRS